VEFYDRLKLFYMIGKTYKTSKSPDLSCLELEPAKIARKASNSIFKIKDGGGL